MAETALLPPRAKEILDRLNKGDSAKNIAVELGISRNAVYQHIGKLRREGYLPVPPARRPEEDPAATIDSLTSSFTERMRHRVEIIDERGRALEIELNQLHAERRKIVSLLESLGPGLDDT